MIQRIQKESFEPLFKSVEDKYPEGIIFNRTDSRGQNYCFMMYRGRKIRRKTRTELETLKQTLIEEGEWKPQRRGSSKM